jgi:acetyltransferase-like isoleucine patch superfamily enzyme
MALADEDLVRLAGHMKDMLLSSTPCWGDPKRVAIGHHVGLSNTLFNTVGGTISVGDYSFFGHNVVLLTGSHEIRKRRQGRRYPVQTSGCDIVIGKGVWIASNATVIGPCTIGDDAVVAAGSVVLGGDLEAGCVYAGAPARWVKKIDFLPDDEQELEVPVVVLP